MVCCLPPCQGPTRLLTLLVHGLQASGPHPGQEEDTWLLLEFCPVVASGNAAGVVGRVVGLVVGRGAEDKSHIRHPSPQPFTPHPSGSGRAQPGLKPNSGHFLGGAPQGLMRLLQNWP